MRLKYWLLILGVVTLALTGCTREPAAPPPPTEAAPSPTSTLPAAAPTPALPVLMGTPVPMPTEPITPDNVDRLQLLAMWGRGRINQVAYSPNGELLAVGTTAGIWIYEAKTLNLLRFIETEQWVRGLIFDPDSLTLKTLLDITTIATWDVSTGQRVHTQKLESIIGQDHLFWEIRRVSFSADGTKLAFLIFTRGAAIMRVGVWDTGSGEVLLSQDKSILGRSVLDLAISPDGSLLAFTTYEGYDTKATIWLWDVRQGVILQTEAAGSADYFLAFSPDGKLLSNGTQVWKTEGLTPECAQGEDIIAGNIAFSPDGLLLAVGVRGGEINVWEAATCRLRQNLTGHRTAILGLVFSPDGGRLVSWSRDGALRQWDSETGALLNTLEGHWPAIHDMAITPDSSTIFISPGFNFGTLDSFDREIYLQDVKTGQRTGVLAGGHVTDAALALSADGKTLASSEDIKNAGKTTLVWDVESGQVRRDIGSPRGGKVALSPDGRKLAIVSLDSKYHCVGVNDSQTDESLYGVCGGRGVAMAFSPDGTRLVLVGDGEAHIFDAETGNQLAALENSGYLVGVPGFSPDGQTVATSTTEGIALWRLNDPQIIHSWQVVTNMPLDEVPGYDAMRHMVAFSPDGRLLASGVSKMAAPQLVIQPALRLWDARQGTALYTVPGYTSNLSRLFFSPDGKLLITASLDGTIRLWGIPPR